MKHSTTKLLLTLATVALLTIALSAIALSAPVASPSQTYDNLYASVQGETNAAAHYYAFAKQAVIEGYPAIANLFNATGDAEAKHADEEWAILEAMGATVRPVAEPVTVGTTKENLWAAFEGETYEYTVMYPEFILAANEEGMNTGNFNAARIFRWAGSAEQVHAGNYLEVYNNISNKNFINLWYSTVYRCLRCGAVYTDKTLPAGNCAYCGFAKEEFIVYTSPISIHASAFVTKLNGNKNDLTVIVTHTYLDGAVSAVSEKFSINNNSAGNYAVGGYVVYVDTKGNDQIRACQIIAYP